MKESSKFASRILPPLYQNSTLSNFENGRAAVQACFDFLKSFPSSSLLFSGNPGSGKTHLACAIYSGLIEQEKVKSSSCAFITAPEFLLEIRREFNIEKGDEGRIIGKYSDLDLLILDDLGSEKSTEFAIQALYILIDRRIRNMKPTVVTTNLSMEQIEEKLNERIASRLSSMSVIKLNLPDHRKKRKGR